MGLSFIFIAHDLSVVRDFADHVMVMQRGEVVEFGTVRQVFEAPRKAYTRALLAASLDPDPPTRNQRIPRPSLATPSDIQAEFLHEQTSFRRTRYLFQRG